MADDMLEGLGFKVDAYVEKIRAVASGPAKGCCERACLSNLNNGCLENSGKVLQFLYSIKPPAASRRSVQLYVMTNFLQSQMREGPSEWQKITYYVPCISRGICSDAFLAVMNVSKSTFKRWKSQLGDNPNPSPLLKQLASVGNPGHNNRPERQRALIRLVNEELERVALSLPMSLDEDDLKRPKMGDHNMIQVLPAHYSFRNLQSAYNDRYPDDGIGSHNTVRTIMEKEMPFARISRQDHAMCDMCMMFRDRIRESKDDKKFPALSSALYIHTQNAEAAKESLQLLRKNKEPTIGVISIDYPRQVFLPKLGNQSSRDWLTTRCGLPVDIFTVIDEKNSRRSANLLQVGGQQATANDIVSLIEYYLYSIHDNYGKVPRLHIFVDSLCEATRDPLFFAYLATRIAMRYHSQIEITFVDNGHMKMASEQVFSRIRTAIGAASNVLSLEQLRECLSSDSSVQMETKIVPPSTRRRWGRQQDATGFFRFISPYQPQFPLPLKLGFCLCSDPVQGAALQMDVKDTPSSDTNIVTTIRGGAVPQSLADNAFFPREELRIDGTGTFVKPSLPVPIVDEALKAYNNMLRHSGQLHPDVFQFWCDVLNRTLHTEHQEQLIPSASAIPLPVATPIPAVSAPPSSQMRLAAPVSAPAVAPSASAPAAPAAATAPSSTTPSSTSTTASVVVPATAPVAIPSDSSEGPRNRKRKRVPTK